MTVNPAVAHFQQHAHEMLAQMQAPLRTFQRVVGPSCRTHLTFLIEAMRQRVDFLLSQGKRKPLLRALRQRLDEAPSCQSSLRLLVTRARDGVYAVLLQSEPFLQRIRDLYGTTKSRQTVPALIGAAIAAFALIILMLLQMAISNHAGDEQAGTVKEATPSLTQVPDWSIFDEIFANEPIRLATSEFGDGVRTSAAALIPDPAEPSGRVMREPVPLPRPRPKRR